MLSKPNPKVLIPEKDFLAMKAELESLRKERDILLATMKWISSSTDCTVEGAQYIHAAVGALKAISPDSGVSPQAAPVAKAEGEHKAPAPTHLGAGSGFPENRVEIAARGIEEILEEKGLHINPIVLRNIIGDTCDKGFHEIVEKAAEFGEQLEKET